MTFATWVLALMTAIRTLYGEAEAPWADTYRDTADGIASRCQGAPMPGGGREWCAGLLVEMSWHESRFQQDARHDHGAGYGLFGTHEATLGRPVPGDADGQAEAALELLRQSWRICASRPFEDRLGWYAAGGLGCSARLPLSRFRIHEAVGLLRKHPAPPP